MAETFEALQTEMQAEMTPPPAAPVEGVPVDTLTPIDDTGSIAEHEAKFQAPRNERGQFQPGQPDRRHRAESQKASPDDVPKINEYTKRLREAEKELGIEQQPGESQRVFELRRRAEIAERVRDANKAKATPAPAVVSTPAPVALPQEFTDVEPKIDDFASEADPHTAWVRALARYDQKKEAHEAQKSQAVASHTDAIQQHRNAYGQRLAAHYEANPDARAVIEAAPHAAINLPIAMEAAIVLSEDGAKFTEYLARNPALFDELYVLSEGRPVTPPLVAHLQRLLTDRATAVATGAAAPRIKVTPAPSLPTPVKTMPQAAPSDGRPKDDDSLSAHEKHYYPNGPRGGFRGR